MNFLRKILLVIMISVFVLNDIFTVEASTISSVGVLTPQDELRRDIIEKNIKIICVKRRISSETVITNISQQADEIFKNLERQIIDDKQWTIIVFSEHFWGNDGHILKSEEVKQIVEKCEALTSKHQKVIVHINFLHKFNKTTISDSNCCWLNERSIEGPDSRICSGQCESNFAIPGLETNLRVANYSLIIWNNRPIAIYRKSTYHDEANALVFPNLNKHVYEFGDFKTHSLITDDGYHREVASIFSGDTPLIITRICADTNDRFLSNIPKVDNSILIVPANFKKLSGEFCKKENFPQNTFIVVCDTALGISLFRIEDRHFSKKTIPITEPDFQHDLFNCYCKMMSDVSDFTSVEEVKERLPDDSVGMDIVDIISEDEVDDESDDACCWSLCWGCSKWVKK